MMTDDEQTYTIPLRSAYRDKPPYKRAPTAVKEVRSFLSQHMKVDEDSVRLSSALNEELWSDGAANPPSKITVVARPDDETLRVITEGERANTSPPEESSETEPTTDNQDTEESS